MDQHRSGCRGSWEASRGTERQPGGATGSWEASRGTERQPGGATGSWEASRGTERQPGELQGAKVGSMLIHCAKPPETMPPTIS